MTRPAHGLTAASRGRPVRRTALLLALLLLAGCTGSPAPVGPSATPPPPETTGPAATTGTTATGGPPTSSGAERPPNVLIVLTDDQRSDTLGVMPKTREEFVDGGALFPKGVATTPLCCPSRSTIMTGRFPHNTGVRGNADAHLLDQDTTVQRYLHDAGYQTGMVGKFLNGWPLDTPPPNFDRFALVDHGYLDRTWNVDGSLREVPGYTTRFIGEQAVDQLRAFAEDPARPWFLYVATTAPHDPWVPAPAYADSPVPPFVHDPAMRETDLSDKPAWVQDPVGVFEHPSVETIAHNRAQQLRTLRSVDDVVGQVFAELDRLGEANDTLAFFLSDNGFLWGEHGLAGDLPYGDNGPQDATGKRFPYLPSVQVPFAVRWPGHVPAGARPDGYPATVDLAPTILQAAGVPAPTDPPMDGRPLLEPGNGGLAAANASVYLEYFQDPLYPGVPSWSSILSDDVQYVRWFDPNGATTEREFYDLADDPYELVNLFGDSSSVDDPDTAALDARIDRERTCTGTAGDRACR